VPIARGWPASALPSDRHEALVSWEGFPMKIGLLKRACGWCCLALLIPCFLWAAQNEPMSAPATPPTTAPAAAPASPQSAPAPQATAPTTPTVTPEAVTPLPEHPIYLDPMQPVDARAADLVSHMTLDEKVSQMQSVAVAIPRLGIPAYDWWNEGLHGVARAGVATVFPQAIGLAATWDTDMMHRVADVISTEARAKYNEAQRNGDTSRYHGLTFWSPNINIFRDPRWGRGQETYGEDPFLTANLAVAFIQGMQGNDPRYLKVVATAKHFAVHSGPEPMRHMFDVHPSETDLEDTYLPAFHAAVVDGRVASVMCAYNAIDGEPACANTNLLQDHLRKTWGFNGYVVSDCAAITDINVGHAYKPTMAEASATAVLAGTDLSCGKEYASLLQAVQAGLIPESAIDTSVGRLFKARILLGMFDPPEMVPYSKIPYSENDSAEHRALSLEAARESIVLLQNSKDILPLGKKIKSIAVIGPSADDPDTLLGNYNGTPSSVVTPLAGIEQKFGTTAKIRYALGATFTDQSDALVPTNALTPPAPAAGSGAGAGAAPANGLLAEYFANDHFDGTPAVSRVEPHVYFNWDMKDPAITAQIPRKAFSVRWTGTLTAPVSGDYTLGVYRLRCDNCFPPGTSSVHIYLDDKLVLDDETPLRRTRTLSEKTVTLEAGHAYAVRIECAQNFGSVGLEFVWRPPADPLLADAVEAVKSSNVTVAFLGINANLEGEEMPVDLPGFKGGDRTTLDLPPGQEKLLEAAIATGKPVVVVLQSGSALSANFAAQHAAAVLEAWYGGEAAGTAIADTLAGDNNPAGRLPVTFYKSVDQIPAFEDYSMQGRTYKYFKGDPLYPFGFGLSYSSFAYSNIRVTREAGASGKYVVEANVKNTSARDGDEVVEAYVSRGMTASDPIRELVGIKRIHLQAGASSDVQFTIDLSPALGAPASASGAQSPAATATAGATGKITFSVGGGQPLPGTQFVEASVQP
jgi:beta-glucosidase